MTNTLKIFLLTLFLGANFSFAKAADVDLKAGDSVTVAGSTVTCEFVERPECKYIAGNGYCARGGLATPATPAKP